MTCSGLLEDDAHVGDFAAAVERQADQIWPRQNDRVPAESPLGWQRLSVLSRGPSRHDVGSAVPRFEDIEQISLDFDDQGLLSAATFSSWDDHGRTYYVTDIYFHFILWQFSNNGRRTFLWRRTCRNIHVRLYCDHFGQFDYPVSFDDFEAFDWLDNCD
jgi:hypothetical protein